VSWSCVSWKDHTTYKKLLQLIIIILTTMFIVLSSWLSHFESSLGSSDECSSAPVGCQLSDQTSQLGP